MKAVNKKFALLSVSVFDYGLRTKNQAPRTKKILKKNIQISPAGSYFLIFSFGAYLVLVSWILRFNI